MRTPPQIRLLPDGRRLHLQDGPIDLIVEAYGTRDTVEAAYRAAARRFEGLLDELCDELRLLRAPASETSDLRSPVARRMAAAVQPYAATHFITPMAAVAGSVADEILAAMTAAASLDKAYVNNGGDIALHLGGGESFRVGLVDRPDHPGLFGTSVIRAADGVRGIATSGRRGRSFSLGIADAVTILAADAGSADAAATIVGNAVDLPGHRGVARVPAASLQPDSDLGERLVTRHVEKLAVLDIDEALKRGLAAARDLADEGRIIAAALHLQGETRTCGGQMALAPPARILEPAYV